MLFLGTFQSDYKDSCEWEIVRSTAERKLLPPNDTNPISVLAFTLNLERKLVFSSYILTLPCVFLAALTLCVFFLPPDRPDRTGLAMSLFQSFLLLLLILVEAAPPTASSVPTLGVYYCFNLVIIMLGIYLSSVVVNLHSCSGSSTKPVPLAVKVIFMKGLGTLLRLRPPNATSSDSSNYTKSSSHNHGNGVPGAQYSDAESRGLLTTNDKALEQSSSLLEPFSDEVDHLDDTQILRNVIAIKTALLTLERKVEKEAWKAEKAQRVVAEWRHVARVLDRLLLIIYLIAIIASLMFLFPRPPAILN